MSMADRDGFIWYDGKLVPWRSATTHVLTHSLHYGLAVFEGVRAYKTVDGTAVFRLEDHTERLFNSAHIYMMKIPYGRETLIEAQKEVVRANQHESCYIRPIAFYGSEKMGVSPIGATVHVAIAAWPWGAYLGAEALEKGIRVKTSSYARHHVNVTMARAKMAGTYPNSILANLEATQHGYDEGLLLDVDGFVAEGSGENLFIVKGGKIHEPELTSALSGITRASVITLANELGYEVVSRRLTRDDIYIADEAFFTGTAAEVTPIRELDGRTIGAGARGPVTTKIQKLFFDVVAPNWIGDALLAQPLFTRLRKKLPGIVIDALAPGWTAPVLRRMPEINEVIDAPFDHGELALGARWRLGRSVRSRRYDRAIVLPNTFKSALVPFFAGIPLRVGFVGESRYGLLNLVHALDEKKRPLMAEPYAQLAEKPGTTPALPLAQTRLAVDEANLVPDLGRRRLSP